MPIMHRLAEYVVDQHLLVITCGATQQSCHAMAAASIMLIAAEGWLQLAFCCCYCCHNWLPSILHTDNFT
jgi:hypothetical protein